MAETIPLKKNAYTKVGARIIAKAYHVACMSECSRSYGSASKSKLLIVVVCKISSDKLPSGHLRINAHVRFDLGGKNYKISKINFQSCSLAPCHVLTSNFIHPPVAPPHVITASNSSQIKVDSNLILTTRNDDNLQEVEAEEVETATEALRNTTRNLNTRNDVDSYGIRWMKNNWEAKRNQYGSITKKIWRLQTVTGEILIKYCDSGKKMSSLDFLLLMFLPS